eukprot:TRINITY_DN11221_c0_g2_i2.p1 TRINITY_DN11221_c0_g2~~TRINITY_DN11221_c0_g2_i2.p1  ORF type:complete len:103 (-),score=24.79 TRINITY_DN11221_c0_g2_i2:965-1273(-)
MYIAAGADAASDGLEVLEKKWVLKLDTDEIDKEKLESVFGRRSTYQAHEEVTPEIGKVADQILAEFGEEVIRKRCKKSLEGGAVSQHATGQRATQILSILCW